MDDQNTTATNPPEQAAEPDQQLLRAASAETGYRRRRHSTTARMSTGGWMRSYYNQVSQGVRGANPIPAEADRPRSPRQPAPSHTDNINNNTEIDGRRTTAINQPQQAAEQPTISQQLLRAASAETRNSSRFTTIRISTRGEMRRRRNLSPDPVVWEYYAFEVNDHPVVSQGVTGANPTPAEADRPRSPLRYPQPAEISRPRPNPLIERRWFRPPLLTLIPHAFNDSERPSDRHQSHQHQQRPELPDQ